jgi:hypothetical protein
MRKIIFMGACLLGLGLAQGQELHIGTSGSLFVSAGDALYVNNNTVIDASGNLTIASNASSSGSLLISGNVTGNITYKRYINDTDWHIVSAPVNSQNINSFAIDAANAINVSGAKYAIAPYVNTLAAGSRWEYYTTATAPSAGSFNSGQGYTINRTSAGELTFSGGMATTDVNVTLNTASGTHYWHSVGNPFPSFFPANNGANGTNVLSQNASILDPSYVALYLWDGSAYQEINHASSALHLSPGQAFMIRAKDDNEMFVLTESLQSHQSGNDNFYRNGNNDVPSIEVAVSNGTDQKTTSIKYFPNTTLGLDPGYDAGAYQDGTPSFSIDTHLVNDSQGIDFTLQCLPVGMYETIRIPLSVRASANEELTFSAAIENLPTDMDVYLEDTVNNTIEKINGGTFHVQLNEAQQGIGRFYLRTSQTALSIDDILSNTAVSIYTTTRRNLRITGLENQGNVRVRMYSITGAVVYNNRLAQQQVLDLALSESLKRGVYVVEVSSEKGIQTKKIILE